MENRKGQDSLWQMLFGVTNKIILLKGLLVLLIAVKRYALACLFVVKKTYEASRESEKAKSVGLESKDAQN